MVDDQTLMQLHGYFFEDLTLGMTAVHGKTLTDADVLMFTGVSGDTNPLHQNREFASQTQFGEADCSRDVDCESDFNLDWHSIAGAGVYLYGSKSEVHRAGSGRRYGDCQSGNCGTK